MFGKSLDRYEASRPDRPDATGATVGTNESRRCVKPEVLPWTQTTQEKAAAACTKTGAQLCTANEMLAACELTPALAI